jgi:formylglycine-generating enzyme required for sulfatase activity
MRKVAFAFVALLGAVAAGYLALTLMEAEPAVDPKSDRTHEVFRDCAECPQMLIIPPGSFVMGWNPRKRDEWLDWIGLRPIPRRIVTIGQVFAVGRYEVTFDEWQACVSDGGCGGHRPDDEGWGRGTRPVIHVSWDDAQAYVRWLSGKTGAKYRLLTEAEWEYAARAHTMTRYPWGPRPSHMWANYGQEECCQGRVSGRDQWLQTAPVGQFPPNGFGLHDMIGNVYEWVEDCFVDSLERAPTDGSAMKTSGCDRHVLRGAAWYSDPERIRVAYRAFQTHGKRDRVIGFRVAKTLK